MQITDGVPHAEQGFQVQMESAVSERGNVNQGGAAVSGLQGQSKIYSYRGAATASLSVDHGEHLATHFVAPDLSLGGGETHESFEQVGGGGGSLHKFTGPGT